MKKEKTNTMDDIRIADMAKASAVPQPIIQMRITVLDNKSVVVNGIPSSLRTALGILFDANKAIVDHFINRAKEGALDDANNIVQSKLITPQNKLII